MAFSSQSGQVGFKTQAAKGAYLDPGATDPNDGVFMRLRSGSMGGDRELIIPDPEIGGDRDIPDAYLGPIAFSGEYEFYGRMNSLATLVQAAFGGGVTTVDVGTASQAPYTHEFSPGDALEWLSVEEAIGHDGTAEWDVFNYTDARVNSIHLEIEPSGYLMGSVGMIALTQSAGNTASATTTVDTTPLMVGTNATITIAATSYTIRSLSLDFTNNLEDDVFQLGSATLADLTPKRRELTMSMTIRPDDSDLWREAVYGGSALTAPASGAAVKSAVSIVIQTYEEMEAAFPYELDIQIPKAAIQPFAAVPSGDDVLEYDIELQALRPLPGTDLTTWTLQTDFDIVH